MSLLVHICAQLVFDISIICVKLYCENSPNFTNVSRRLNELNLHFTNNVIRALCVEIDCLL